MGSMKGQGQAGALTGNCRRVVQAAAAGKDVSWLAAHCGHVLVPAHHEVFVVDDLHKDAR
jgi:hypothetical protein